MTIENSLALIAKSLEIIAKQLTEAPPVPSVTATPEVVAPVVAPTLPPLQTAPIVTTTPAVAPVAPTPPPVTNTTPFSDAKGMIAYVMAAYQALGAEKGAKIQQVLASMGVTNINEVKPEQYATLYTGVEALK